MGSELPKDKIYHYLFKKSLIFYYIFNIGIEDLDFYVFNIGIAIRK